MAGHIYQKDVAKIWRDDIRAAKELGYPPVVIAMLEAEPNVYKRTRIMTSARNGHYDKKKKKGEK